MRRFAVGLALLAAVTLPARAGAAVPTPRVAGPITSPGGAFVASTFVDLAPLGYVEEEFFLSGTATAHTSAAPLGSDGRWAATPGETAAYTTRVLLRRPAEPRKFNGTVIVEWLNVSAGLDSAPDWIFTHSFLMREGYAWMGVSAQLVGVAGSGGPLGLNLSLKAANPVRYAPLQHPGDSFSYDMFSQAAQALRAAPAAPLLGGARPKRVIAAGESQSAFRMVTYVNAVHPLAGVYDGFLIHSRAGSAAALSQAPQPDIPGASPSLIREDVDVPVLTFQTETDVVTLGSLASRQPDTKKLRLWEVAGTAHGDAYQLAIGMNDAGLVAADVTHAPLLTTVGAGFITCDRPVNAGQQQYVLSAAIARLDRWVRTGRPPRRAPRLDVDPGPPPAFRLDDLGNALGGIRPPAVAAPVSVLSGLGQTGASFCRLFGTTVPLDPATLSRLYPTSKAYVRAVSRAARAAVRAGFLLPPDAHAIRESAAASGVGG